ncbi:MAG: hypothetical protein LC797_08660, partial [Chloroflexi bacterium]|nr:hypothetical protein [Chloroflexota bacterium]
MPDGHSRPDFLLLCAPPWSGPTRFSKHHLAHHLARTGARVLYVEAPLSPLGLRRGRPFLTELAQSLAPPRRVAERLWVRRHFVPVPYHGVSRLTSRRAANRLGQRLLAPAISRDLAGLGFGDPILIAGLPHAVDLLPWLPHRALVYHCADDYAHMQGFADTLPELESDLCQQADLLQKRFGRISEPHHVRQASQRGHVGGHDWQPRRQVFVGLDRVGVERHTVLF